MPGGFNINFGDVYGSETTRLVPIHNAGSDTLKLNSVSASCGCTAALVTKSRIAPGDTGFLSIKFDARRFAGKVRKSVSMQSNDTSHKYINITFDVNVLKTLMFDPEYLYYTVDVDSPSTKTVKVENAADVPISVLSLKGTSAAITASIDKKTLAPGEVATITATFAASATGTQTGGLEIVTDHPKNPLFAIRVFALAKRSH